MRPHRAETVGEAAARALARARRDGDCLRLGPSNRYPPVRVAGRLRPASRVVLEAIRGPLPADKPMALHSCVGVFNCIEPEHLRAGDHRDNAADMVRAGRSIRGTRHPRHRLTARRVREARAARRRGVPVQAIADRLGLPRSTVSGAIRGVNWGWLSS